MKNSRRTAKGFAHLGILVLAIVLVAVIGLAYARIRSSESPINNNQTIDQNMQQPKRSTSEAEVQNKEDIRWTWMDDTWKPSSKPPACDDPVRFSQLPSDISRVTAMLYPGQTRGGDYKPHGGFRFDSAKDNNVDVRAIMEGDVVSGSRYIEIGEVQYMFTIENDCGIAYRFDHLLKLSPEFQKLADMLPEAKPDDSRTTNFDKPIRVSAGDLIATAVGHTVNNNVSYDLGVYDYRTKNDASNAQYETKHARLLSQASYARCWFDMFGESAATTIRSLPSADGTSGKTSDYCK